MILLAAATVLGVGLVMVAFCCWVLRGADEREHEARAETSLAG